MDYMADARTFALRLKIADSVLNKSVAAVCAAAKKASLTAIKSDISITSAFRSQRTLSSAGSSAQSREFKADMTSNYLQYASLRAQLR
ncbi:hypothetical protein, partial [Enterobacter pasteurii]|uniref:hypothetical protein n=1 Tax=Enterobacter pasteurii TaxID=3029761 RepID=UPI00210B97CC